MNAALSVKDLIDKEIEAGQSFGPFHQWWLLERAPEKVRRNLTLARQHPDIIGANQGFQSMDLNAGVTAAFSARNSSLSELNMLGADANGVCPQAIINQFCAIPANDARAGKGYQLRMGGIYGNTGTPTMIFNPRWGSSTTAATNVALGASPTWTSITGTSSLPYMIDFEFWIRTAPPGATAGTGYGTGIVSLGIPVTSSQNLASLYIGGGTPTIDTTGQGAAGCGLTIGLTWSASSVSNTSTCQWFRISSLN